MAEAPQVTSPTNKDLQDALALPRNIKRKLQPEDRIRNEGHLALVDQEDFEKDPRLMASFDDEGNLISVDNIDWYKSKKYPELGAYQHKDELALAVCRVEEKGEYEGSNQEDQSHVGKNEELRDESVVAQDPSNVHDGQIDPIEASNVRVQEM